MQTAPHMCRYCPAKFHAVSPGILEHQICKNRLLQMDIPDLIAFLGNEKQAELAAYFGLQANYKSKFQKKYEKQQKREAHKHQNSYKNYHYSRHDGYADYRPYPKSGLLPTPKEKSYKKSSDKYQSSKKKH